MDNTTTLLTATQTADLLQVHTNTLSRWRLRNTGPRYIRISDGPRGVRYRRADLERWLQQRTQTPAAAEQS